MSASVRTEPHLINGDHTGDQKFKSHVRPFFRERELQADRFFRPCFYEGSELADEVNVFVHREQIRIELEICADEIVEAVENDPRVAKLADNVYLGKGDLKLVDEVPLYLFDQLIDPVVIIVKRLPVDVCPVGYVFDRYEINILFRKQFRKRVADRALRSDHALVD